MSLIFLSLSLRSLPLYLSLPLNSVIVKVQAPRPVVGKCDSVTRLNLWMQTTTTTAITTTTIIRSYLTSGSNQEVLHILFYFVNAVRLKACANIKKKKIERKKYTYKQVLRIVIADSRNDFLCRLHRETHAQISAYVSLSVCKTESLQRVASTSLFDDSYNGNVRILFVLH